MVDQPNSFLLETDNAQTVSAISDALRHAGIPFETGLQSQGRPSVVIFVPHPRLREAQRLIRPAFIGDGRVDPDTDDPDDDEPFEDDDTTIPAAFPWGPVQAVFTMILLHTGMLFWAGGSLSSGRNITRNFALIPELTFQEPWRLVTSTFLHADLRHVGWNSVSMLVFAVPLLTLLGLWRTGFLYFASGIGGGLAATLLASGDTMIIGSSGAVAGLFGAWIGLMANRARRRHFGWRGYVRTAGIALLVLPSFIHPVDAAGRTISVASHIGGMLTGMIVGVAISWVMLKRHRARDPEPYRSNG